MVARYLVRDATVEDGSEIAAVVAAEVAAAAPRVTAAVAGAGDDPRVEMSEAVPAAVAAAVVVPGG
jgi:hypothetical protein